MREIDKYGVLKEKLQGICDEHNLVHSIKNRAYPFHMIIKPAGGMDAQQTMLEGMDNPGDTGYISPDASLVFVFRDGELSYKISETWTISANLFNKLKNQFLKLCNMWMAYFFRDIHEHSPSAATMTDSAAGDEELAEPPAEGPDFPADAETPFDEFLVEAESAEESTINLDEDGFPIDESYVRSIECPEEEETEDATPEDTGADE